jgi:hypothetical protein
MADAEPTQLTALTPVGAPTPAALPSTLSKHIEDASRLHYALNVFGMDEAQQDARTAEATAAWLDNLNTAVTEAGLAARQAASACDATLLNIAEVRKQWLEHMAGCTVSRASRLNYIVGK